MYTAILDPITNRQTWSESFQIVDDNKVAVDISAATIGVYVRDQRSKDCAAFALRGTTSDGHITLPNGGTDGIFTWTFTDTEVRTLCPVTHDVSIYVTISGVVTPMVIATVAVFDGIKP